MKKLLMFIFVCVLGLALISCDTEEKEDKLSLENEVKILVPNGIPYIALGSLVGEEKVTIENKSADNLTAGLLSNDYDIIVAPLNMGVKLYNAGNSTYRLAAVLTQANTYIVSRKATALTSLSDLNNKKVIAFGKTSVPGILFEYALKEANVTPSEIKYEAGVDVAMSLFVASNDYDYLLVSEPYLTNLEKKQNVEINILNLENAVFDNTDISNIYQASIFVKERTDDVNKVLEKIEKDVKEINENTTEFVESIIEKDEFFSKQGKENLISSLPRSSITYIKASEEKANIEAFLAKLLELNKAMIGEKMPSEDFYN